MVTDHSQPTDEDTGKSVVDSTGQEVGIVNAVEGGTIHVETDPGLTDSIKATLGWGDTEGTQTIDASHVAEITDDAVHLAADDPVEDVATSETAGTEGTGADGTVPGDTGTGTGHEDESTDRNDLPPEQRRDDPVDGDLSGDETAAEMDDAGDVTDQRTTGERGASGMTDEGVSERDADRASDEMGVPAGEDDPEGSMEGRNANERPPGTEDTPGRQDVQNEQVDDRHGSEDVQDPVPDEPRDAEDVQDTAADLNPESEADPEDQPSTSEAATRGAEEDADLGREDDEDRT
ncbi:midas domain-containing protein [Halalkalicoccus jeotgali]|uniref:Uncharacterized protein n=1 Tax=Halalkalicoccus jeotgali (strain DSM 18796 / CECT 7217 / JCM 14584 / KCTC 4019 / B3) TaxID=795797 RepID=D8J9R2_HALJB|nr:DUF2171 domain-containing protein [Halalkalicoccus jeotgali]ADJ16401.1 hypothetical protein HacjB3_15110 [Halalkalicoccus jeotgali B3]ELY37135.1 hypothetical protein C497_10338 [Halalkalicoccus jeotgali B3]